jgi:UDP-N-acetylglucosamine:LPS N-acetylglucosamine transferase
VTRIDFIFFDAGGGHRAAATALKAVIEEQNRPWEVRMINLQELLDPLDVFRKVTGIRLQEIYNKLLARGWTLGAAQGLQFMHAVIRMYHRPTVRLLSKFWAQQQPQLIVSLVPNFNRALFESARGIPYVTILTDFADYPPHFWIESQKQFVICGTQKAVEQARALGHTPERIRLTSGMILRPQFYRPQEMDRAEERRKLGLEADRPTGVVLFGGQGSRVMLEIAERLPETQLILMCGRNQKLADSLGKLPSRMPRLIQGFTEKIPYYMQLADFFIGKPGPGSISEAVAMKLPVIVERNIRTLPQERYNADWVLEHQAGLVLTGFSGIAAAVDQMLARLPEFRANVDQIRNQAVYEIPEILNDILRKSVIN